MAFSCPDSQERPKSLKKILDAVVETFTEKDQEGKIIKIPDVGNNCLDFWEENGILLLNSALTLEKSDGKIKHHFKIWHPFIEIVIKKLNEDDKYKPFFLLWGNKAKRYGAKKFMVDAKHYKKSKEEKEKDDYKNRRQISYHPSYNPKYKKKNAKLDEDKIFIKKEYLKAAQEAVQTEHGGFDFSTENIKK